MRDTVTERADGSGMFAPSAGLSTQQSLGSSLQLTKFGLRVFSQVTALVNSQVFGPFLGPKFPKFPNDDFSVRVLTHPSRPLTRQETSKKKKNTRELRSPTFDRRGDAIPTARSARVRRRHDRPFPVVEVRFGRPNNPREAHPRGRAGGISARGGGTPDPARLAYHISVGTPTRARSPPWTAYSPDSPALR